MSEFKMLAVVVLYETPLRDAETIISLQEAFSTDVSLAQEIQVVIWDNSAKANGEESLGFPFEYRHSGENIGLSGAYNRAAAAAQKAGIPWLLLLDQDTKLPPNFFRNILKHAMDQLTQTNVAAVVPTVYVRDFIVSPRRMLFNRHVAYPDEEPCLAEGEAASINSGSLLRVNDLLEIGGFSEAFWLDYSDWYVFHQLFLQGKRVWRATNVCLQHSMTVMDYDNLMTPGRYRNYLDAEGAFNDLYKGKLENAIQTFRTLVRAIKQKLKYKNPIFSRMTWTQFTYRLRTRRDRRIRRWLEKERQCRTIIPRPGTGDSQTN